MLACVELICSGERVVCGSCVAFGDTIELGAKEDVAKAGLEGSVEAEVFRDDPVVESSSSFGAAVTIVVVVFGETSGDRECGRDTK